MFYYIPIEPLNERYTEQWYRWFPEALKKRKVPFQVIDGEPLNTKVECGTFLDINSTLHYKAEQLKKIAKLFFEKKIKPGDIFFVADLEFWGIESIRYLSDLNNIPVNIYAFLHAASYTCEDFMEKCSQYGKVFEEGWFKICDKIFVGSEYHKKQVEKLRPIAYDKIVVTGNPYNIKEVKDKLKGIKIEKKNQIILTNRPDYEKRPNLSLDVFRILKRRHPDWDFMITTSRKAWGKGWIREVALNEAKYGWLKIRENLLKEEYLIELAKSKVMISNTIEENFGYCILEACIFDTIPIIENNYSHPELVNKDKRCLFNSIDEQIKKVEFAMANPFKVNQYVKKYEESLDLILEYCLFGKLKNPIIPL